MEKVYCYFKYLIFFNLHHHKNVSKAHLAYINGLIVAIDCAI